MNRLSRLGAAYAAERPVRTGLVAVSVALGVAVVLGVGAGVATVNRSVNGLGAAVPADVVVSGVGPFGTHLPGSVPARLAATDGVRAAAAVSAQDMPLTSGAVTGKVVTLGVPLDRVGLLADRAAAGRLPRVDGEIAVSSRVARDLHLRAGITVTLGAAPARVVGILGPGVTGEAGTNQVVLASSTAVEPTDPVFALIRLQSRVNRGVGMTP